MRKCTYWFNLSLRSNRIMDRTDFYIKQVFESDNDISFYHKYPFLWNRIKDSYYSIQEIFITLSKTILCTYIHTYAPIFCHNYLQINF